MAAVADPLLAAPLLQGEAASPCAAVGEDQRRGSGPVHHYIGKGSPSAINNQKGDKEATESADRVEGRERPTGPDLGSKTAGEADDREKKEEKPPSARGQDDNIGETAAAIASAAAAQANTKQVAGQRRRLSQTSFADHSFALAKSSKNMLVAFTSLSRADIWSAMNMRFENWQALRLVAEALGVSPAFVATATVTGILGFLLFGIGGSLICAVVGALYPAFESYKAVETNDVEVMRFWMTYWIVYAIMQSVECACYYVIVYLPFYYPMKLAALMWLCSWSTGGAKYLYMLGVAPTFGAYRQSIDDALEQSRDSIKQGVKHAAAKSLEYSVATGNGGMAVLKRSISGAGLGMGTMARIAYVAVKTKSRRGSSLSELGEDEVATPAVIDAAPAGEGDSPKAEEPADDEAQKNTTEPAGEEAQKKNTADVGADDAHSQEKASVEDDGLVGSPPCFRGPEVAPKVGSAEQ